MADFAPAVEKTLQHEGSAIVKVPATGEVARYGVTVWFLRDAGVSVSFPDGAPRNTPATSAEIDQVFNLRPQDAAVLYREHFWNRNLCGQINDQAIAEKVFDLSVNMGPGQAAKLLQHAVNVFEWPKIHLVEDGVIGPKTIAAVNAAAPKTVTAENLGESHTLLSQLKAEAEAFYRNLAAAKPVLASNLNGWLSRVNS